MDWVVDLFRSSSVAHTVLVLSLVTASGLAVGSLRIRGVGLGIAGVLFTGLLFSHFGLTIDAPLMEFIAEFGLILFVYAIGLQVGPSFLASFRREGTLLNGLAIALVGLGGVVSVLLIRSGKLDHAAAVGLLAGATTNTPSLAAAQQVFKDAAQGSVEAVATSGLAYATAYPFGILGIILTLVLIRLLFRIDPQQEAAEFLEAQRPPEEHAVSSVNLEVTNPNLDGMTVKEIPLTGESGIVISRILHGQRVRVAGPGVRISLGDVLLAVGPQEQLQQLRVVVGRESSVDVRSLPSHIATQRIIVTKLAALGKTVEELDLLRRHGVTITRISRADIEFTPGRSVRLQFGDTVLAVGEAEDLRDAAAELGNSPRQLNHPQLIPVFLGIALGTLLGSWPLQFPGMPTAVKLGMAGGPLLVAILLSRIGRIGPFIWYMPISANVMLRELGIVLFLACVGLRSGGGFVQTFTEGAGWTWVGWGALITLIPLLIVGIAGRLIFRLNFAPLCGLLSGGMTDPPALAFAHSITHSDAPSVSYATVYPLVMLLRVFVAQALAMMVL